MAFTISQQRHLITKIIRQARNPQGKLFEVEADEGSHWQLIYDEYCDKWQITEI